jgi:hypothetical protein
MTLEPQQQERDDSGCGPGRWRRWPIAMYASSNGQPSTNRADFDWFEYVGFEV